MHAMPSVVKELNLDFGLLLHTVESGAPLTTEHLLLTESLHLRQCCLTIL
jgi:hypothetical protein